MSESRRITATVSGRAGCAIPSAISGCWGINWRPCRVTGSSGDSRPSSGRSARRIVRGSMSSRSDVAASGAGEPEGE
jgi:hypothetical protein